MLTQKKKKLKLANSIISRQNQVISLKKRHKSVLERSVNRLYDKPSHLNLKQVNEYRRERKQVSTWHNCWKNRPNCGDPNFTKQKQKQKMGSIKKAIEQGRERD